MSRAAFGALLRAAREAAGLSQRALARRSGVTHTYVSALELGAAHPSRAVVDALAGALDLGRDDWARWRLAAGYAPPDGSPHAPPDAPPDAPPESSPESPPEWGDGAPARPPRVWKFLDARAGERRAELARGHRARLERAGYELRGERAEEDCRVEFWVRGALAVALLVR